MSNEPISSSWQLPMSASNVKRAATAMLAALTCFYALNPARAFSQSLVSGKVDFGTSTVPKIQNPMTVIHLSPQAPPAAFVTDALGKMGAATSKIGKLANNPLFADSARNVPESMVGLVDNGTLRAYWDERTGDAEIFPLFDSKAAVAESAGKQKIDTALNTAQQIFARQDIIPHDATQSSVGEPRPVLGTDASRTSEAGPVTESQRSLYLTYVSLHRKVDGFPVYGPGSAATLAIGNDGSVQGFVRRWNQGTAIGSVAESRTRDQVKAEILKQLEPLTANANVKVLSIEVAYYDGQSDSIQPVYRVTAAVHFLPHSVPGVKPADKLSDDEFIVRYLPVSGGTLQLATDNTQPSEADKPNVLATVPENDPTVGRYVVRNDDPGWVASANGFWNNISAWPYGGYFSNVQYYWAYPFEFTTSELSYINSVNVGLNEVHGNWWYFTTYQNWGDGVDLTQISASNGYGTAASGHLFYWTLHSCEVVPSAADAPCPSDNRSWWTPWFNIFRGMHTVVGYRTIMYIDDGVTSPYANSIMWVAPVISAWFNAANSASDYQGNPTYQAHCGNYPPMGRPSAVTVCGQNNDTIYNLTTIPAAGCLTNYWQPN